MALVIYGNYMTRLVDPYLYRFLPAAYQSELNLLLIQTLLATGVLLIAGEFLPKMLFRINPNETLAFFAVPVLVFYFLFYPVVWLILAMAHVILRKVFGLQLVEIKPAFGRIDLDHYIQNISSQDAAKGQIHSEIEMFRAALGFHHVKIRNCMVPRPEIVAMNINDKVESLRSKFISTGLSRILIYRDSLDHITGFVHSFEMFKRPETIRSVLLPVSILPESMSARDLLKHFTQEHRSVAAVVDEHGITSGMVTVEDVIEEIFGEIRDEHDIVELVEQQVSSSEFIFSGRLEIDYLNDRYGLEIPVGTYETLAGFILHYHEHIPRTGEVIVIGSFLFKILLVKNNRLEQVKMKRDEGETTGGLVN